MDHSPGSDGEDNVKLTKLFKKEAIQVPDVNDNDDGRKTISNKTVKGKSPNKVKQTPERKMKNEDGSERGVCSSYPIISTSYHVPYQSCSSMKQILMELFPDSDFIYNYAGKRAKGKDAKTRNTPEKHGKSHVRSFFFSSSC